jgi:hypothetical protein
MGSYLLIESRDPWTFRGVPETWELARRLQGSGDKVTLFLVENGVLATRGAFSKELEALANAGVKVLADDFSLLERGIAAPSKGVATAPLDTVVDHLAEGSKVLWN